MEQTHKQTSFTFTVGTLHVCEACRVLQMHDQEAIMQGGREVK